MLVFFFPYINQRFSSSSFSDACLDFSNACEVVVVFFSIFFPSFTCYCCCPQRFFKAKLRKKQTNNNSFATCCYRITDASLFLLVLQVDFQRDSQCQQKTRICLHSIASIIIISWAYNWRQFCFIHATGQPRSTLFLALSLYNKYENYLNAIV